VDNKKLTITEKADFFNTLSMVYRTGVSIPVILEDQLRVIKSPSYRRLLRRIIGGTKSGRELSTLMDRAFGFSKADISLVKSAERCGEMPAITKELGDYYHKLHTFRSRLKNALVTPILLFSAAVFIASLPVLFSEGTAKYIIDVVSTFLIVTVIAGAGTLAFLFLQKKSKDDKRCAEAYLSIPFWGPIAKNIDLYRFNRLLSLAISAGEGMGASLQIAAGGVHNCILKNDIFKARYLIEKKGMTLKDAFAGSEYLRGIGMRIMTGGEISGTLDAMTSKFSAYTYEDILHQIEMLVKKIRIGSYTLAMLYIISRIFMLLGNIYKSSLL